MSKGKRPTYDAAAATASQQSANNTATSNNAKAANQTGPFGSATTQLDASGMPIGQTRTLSEPLQAAGNNVQAGVQQSSSWLPGQKFSLSDVPDGMDIAGSTYKQGMNYLQPEFDRQNKTHEVRMSERGLPIGSEAWKDSTATLGDTQGRQMTDLAMRSILATPAEQQRQIGNQLLEREQGYKDTGQGISLLSAMNQLAPQNTPIAQQTPVNASDAYGKQYQSEADAYAAKQAGYQNFIKTGVGLATMPFAGPMGMGSSLLGMGLSNAGNMFNTPGGGFASTGGTAPGPNGREW